MSAAGAKTSREEDEIALHETIRRLFVSQSRKWRTVSGMEGRPGAVRCGVMPLIFNKLVNQHADTGAGDGRNHKELSPWETRGRTLKHLRPWDQGHLGQVCRLPPMPTRKTAAPPTWSPASMPDPLPHYQFSTSSQSELLKCNFVFSFKFIKFLSPGHVMLLLKPSDGFLLHLEQNPEFLCKPHDPVRSLFLFLEQIHLATITEPLYWLFALARPLSRKPQNIPRLGVSHHSVLSSTVISSLKSLFISLWISVPPSLYLDHIILC